MHNINDNNDENRMRKPFPFNFSEMKNTFGCEIPNAFDWLCGDMHANKSIEHIISGNMCACKRASESTMLM